MKKLLTILILCLLLGASDCQREGPNCHKSIFIQNKSQDTVIIATVSRKFSTSLCRLGGLQYLPGQNFEFYLRVCWEDELTYSSQQHVIYIVDPSHYNDLSYYYDCDSIEFYNHVLEKYTLTLENLRANDFIITYP